MSARPQREFSVFENEFVVTVCQFVSEFCIHSGEVISKRRRAKTYECQDVAGLTFLFEDARPARGCTLKIWFHPDQPFDGRAKPVLDRWWRSTPENGEWLGRLCLSMPWRERILELMHGVSFGAPAPRSEPSPIPVRPAERTQLHLVFDDDTELIPHPTIRGLTVRGEQLTGHHCLREGDLHADDDGFRPVSPFLYGQKVVPDSGTMFVRPKK